MRTEVYAKGEPTVECNRIASVVVRDRGRPRRPLDTSVAGSAYSGVVISTPDEILREIGDQVEAEASPQVVADLSELRNSCPWRHHVPPTAPFEPSMLRHLLGPFGQNLFTLIVARLPGRAPGADGVTNQV